ncbi:PadR family transcriptional regulator [Candidatus Woesearchaeota archaeon]|nr:PadR family transcriptional regulator [Candidatus Woesearchaeota archaeon]MBW3005413.1 PadR family transcriptional regulator [Candidatus Woesearchaeota archaeon]
MIRGNLKLLVLKALDKKPLSGYALMKFIEEKIGSKPSPGSIYPVLDDLTKQKFVSCKKDGRKKIYSITKEGKEHLKIIAMHKDILLKKVEESLKMWSALTGEKLTQFQETVEALKKGKYSIEDIPPEVQEFKIELARIFSRGLFPKNKKKVKELLSKTIKELKKIK